MLKKIAAIGLGAALVLSPLAAFAQTDTTAPATGAAPAAGTDTGAAATPMKKKTHHSKKHMAKSKKSMAPAAEGGPAPAPAANPQ